MLSQDEKDIDLIENYLKGALSPEESALVKKRIIQDPDFAEKINDYKDVIDGIRLSGRDEFSAAVADWEKDIRKEEGGSREIRFTTFPKKYLRLAAVFLVLMMAALYIVISSRSDDPQELYASYFAPYEDVINVRDNSTTTGLSDAMEFYNKGDYKKASSSFQAYLSDHPDDHDARFYAGVSQLAAGSPELAIIDFEKVIQANTIFREQAEWFLALGYLKINNTTAAKNFLREISQKQGHDYQEKATELLRQL